MRDYAFYDSDDAQGRVAGPARSGLRRLLGPVWQREEALFRSLDADLGALQEHVRAQEEERRTVAARQEELHERQTVLEQRFDELTRHVIELTGGVERLIKAHEELRDEVLPQAVATRDARVEQLAAQLRAVAALGWDHTALARRIAAIEDDLGRQASIG